MQRIKRSRTKPNQLPVIFVKFCCDLVSFGLKDVLDVHWESPYGNIEGRPFEENVGMAAVVFRYRHADQFSENIENYPVYVFADADTIVEYLQHFIQNTFEGSVPLMEFIVYCAFLVDLAVVCFNEEQEDYVVEIVEKSYDVYEDHIKRYFHAMGGWPAVSRMAEHYLQYVKAMKGYSALERREHRNTSADHSRSKNTSRVLRADHTKDNAHSDSSHLTGSVHRSAGGNDSTATADSDVVDVSTEESDVRGSVRDRNGSRSTAVGDDSRAGAPDDNGSCTSADDHSPATSNAPATNLSSPTQHMKNGWMTPSTVTSENAAKGSADIDFIE